MTRHQPFLIIQTGDPAKPLQRHKNFAHWIRVAAGLDADDAVTVNVHDGHELPETREGFAGVMVTGSAAMVTDKADWSERTAKWLREAAHEGSSLLGICYGHQLLAHALGGEVGYLPSGREMGTVQIDLHGEHAQHDPLFQSLPSSFPAQVTHMQTVLTAPPDAVVLARSEQDTCHAFRWGQRVWGLQFHPEFSRTTMQGYVRARADALRGEGRDPRALAQAVSATPHARKVLRQFVRHSRQVHAK